MLPALQMRLQTFDDQGQASHHQKCTMVAVGRVVVPFFSFRVHPRILFQSTPNYKVTGPIFRTAGVFVAPAKKVVPRSHIL